MPIANPVSSIIVIIDFDNEFNHGHHHRNPFEQMKGVWHCVRVRMQTLQALYLSPSCLLLSSVITIVFIMIGIVLIFIIIQPSRHPAGEQGVLMQSI